MFDLIISAASIHGAYWMEGAGAIYCENEAMKWLVSLAGLPEGAFGVFTSGGTAANLSAIVTARENWRAKTQNTQDIKGIILTSVGAHSSVKSMTKVVDADVYLVESEEKLGKKELEKAIARLTPLERRRLFAIVGTGGTTNAGIIDKLDEIADVCEKEDLWFHVDCAYGGGALASRKLRPLFKGVERADSITIDPHKWLFTPYDCGAILYKQPELAKKAHAQEGTYLEIFKDPGAHGFNPSDYQIQLTRRVRGVPFWFSLAMHGTDRYEESIDRCVELAAYSAKQIEANSNLEMVRETSLSCVLFRRKGWSPQDYRDWTYKNIETNFALITPSRYLNNGVLESVARFCFINPDTTENDIDEILNTMN